MSEDLKCASCGEVHRNAKFIRTEDGRELALQSEAFTRYCQARYALRKYRTNKTRKGFLDKWRESKGEMEWAKLREEMLRLYDYRQKGK